MVSTWVCNVDLDASDVSFDNGIVFTAINYPTEHITILQVYEGRML